MAHPATALGRIRRIGIDTVTNYSYLQTTGYDTLDPAANTSAWPDDDVLDQDLIETVPPGNEVTADGVLVTFDRDCPFFMGVMVKVKPAYTVETDIVSALQLWTHDAADNVWTLRRSIIFADPFVGIPTGQYKIFDLRLAVAREGVDQVWVTLAPKPDASVTLTWSALHPFGRCHIRIVTPGSCEDDPTTDCIDPDPCEDPNDPDCLVPPTDCHDLGPNVCSIPPFDWPKIPPGATGGGDSGPADDPSGMPPVELCDPAELQAFKDSMTPEQLAYFEELLTQVELPCLDPDEHEPNEIAPINAQPDSNEPLLPGQPIEGYTDPETGQYGNDPRDEGGEDNPPGDDDRLTRTFRYILTWSGNDLAEADTLVTANIPPPVTGLVPVPVNYGPAEGVSTLNLGYTPAAYGLRFLFENLPAACRIGFRMQVFRLRGAIGVANSISSDGIRERVGVGQDGGADWELSLSPTLHLATDARPFIGESYFELYHQAFVNSTEVAIVLRLPRVDAAQNDALPADPMFNPRSQLGMQRSGMNCASPPPTITERDRWLHDISNEDYDATTIVDYRHRRPFGFVVDVTFRAQVIGEGFGVGSVSLPLDPDEVTPTFFAASVISGLTDTQPVESC